MSGQSEIATSSLSSLSLTRRLALGVLFLCCFILVHTAQPAPARPHILVVMADDLGWNDLGARDPEMHTPNIDRLAAEGVNLTHSYMQQVCTGVFVCPVHCCWVFSWSLTSRRRYVTIP